ncbi:hypothetical protein [Halogeometricum limi]|uniref:Ig-like domain-containing protein n=1 Tax=Halogeometricum limi TaxID=555875 RepID=A0A1I6HBF5_9EURY|nr:hypothetical protein [Halogeometricum limi]SFR51607.1 hypothetical protein SAMN04488124_1999 [Halogeometricum limi]
MPTRRTVLASLSVVGATSLAGCDALGRTSPESTPERETTASRATSTSSGTAAAEATSSSSLPYRAADETENVDRPRGVVVRNVGVESRFATVVVARGDETVFVESADYAPQGTGRTRRYPELVARRGTYEVYVETGDGATGRGVLRVDDVHDDAVVELGPAVRVRQTVRCAPDCGAISRGGDAKPFGNPRWPEVDAWAGYTVTVANAGENTHDVRVVFDVDGETVLDYRYRPPRGTVLGFPTVPPLRRLRVTVEANGDRWRGRLDEDRSVALPLAVDGDGVRVDAWPDAGADLRVRNERGPRTVTVTLTRSGNRVAEWSGELDENGTATVDDFVPGPGLYRVVMTLGDGGDGGARTSTRSVVVTRHGLLLVRARDGVDAFFVR